MQFANMYAHYGKVIVVKHDLEQLLQLESIVLWNSSYLIL